jgi:hypothetical protein
MKKREYGFDVLELFKGLTPLQAEKLAEKIGASLPALRKEIEDNTENTEAKKAPLNSETLPKEAKEMDGQDRELLEKMADLQNEIDGIKRDREAERLAKLDEEERAELAALPRGVVGLKLRSNVNAKFQELRFGKRTNGSLDWLQAQRESNQLVIEDTDDQHELMRAYHKAVAPWRGQIGKVSKIQSQFRARGLKGI